MTKLNILTKLIVLFCCSITLSALKSLPAQAINTENKKLNLKTNLPQKYYQQALYYYFQGHYSDALNIISQSKSRLGYIEPSAQLFLAGLQIRICLQEEARENLLQLSTNLPFLSQSTPYIQSEVEDKFKASYENLLVLALLALAEQYIELGENTLAQKTLKQINKVPLRHYQKYHVLSQLAYWPLQPELIQPSMKISIQGSEASSLHEDVKPSPYIELNNALRLIEMGKFEQGTLLLSAIKQGSWQASEKSFFQSVFSNESQVSIEKERNEKIQNQAIIDYARLLQSHLYVQRGLYEKAFAELQYFPQESAYADPALFLYAYSALKIKDHASAFNLLSLLQKQSPNSALAWQSNLLFAQLLTDQRGLQQGLQAYQNVEAFFLSTIEKLKKFEKSFNASDNLLSFSEKNNSLTKKLHSYFAVPEKVSITSKVNPYETESIWLQQALNVQPINNLYNQLSQVTALQAQGQVLQEKSDWVLNIIRLNIKKKARLSANYKSIAPQDDYGALSEKRAALATKFSNANKGGSKQYSVFANQEEQAWLQRIKRSQNSLSYIEKYNNEQAIELNSNYHQRLNRINSVLAWELSQKHPQRAWQHEKLLNSIDKSLLKTESLQKSVTILFNETSTIDKQTSLTPFLVRQSVENRKINPLKENLTQLKKKITLKIRVEIARYIKAQHSVLNDYLLANRKAMAIVLEELAVADNKEEQQLNLSDKESREKVR